MVEENLKIISGLKKFFQSAQLGYQNVEILDLSQIMGGMETLIYSFMCKYKKNGKLTEKKLILRMYTAEKGGKTASNEFEVLKKLRIVNYPVPRVHFQETTSNYVGKPFIILEYIDGVLMGAEMEKSLNQKDTIKSQGFITYFTELFIQLHQIKWQSLTDNPEQYLDDPKQNLTDFITWYEKKIQKLGLTSLKPILKWLWMKLTTIKSGESDLALNHGDFHPYNIMLDNERAYVIDWHGIRIRDYRIDLAQTSILLEMYASKDLRNNIIALYENKRGKIKDFPFFEVLLILVRFYEFFAATSFDQDSMTEERIKMFKEQSGPTSRAYSLLVERTGQNFPELEGIIRKEFHVR